MTLFELIPTPDTAPELSAAMAEYAGRRLGKGVIVCNDTPLFVANRVGLLARMCTIWGMIEEGLSIEQVDAVASQPMGRPKTGVFRLGDLIGLDTTANVARYLYSVAVEDERREMFRMPPFIEKLLADGALGNKSGRGYYQKVGSEIRVLDWKSGNIVPLSP
ncbi:MAG: 3-hydroxyacyl-CoA dehydrogenase family protein [Planctomycetota bacterium]